MRQSLRPRRLWQAWGLGVWVLLSLCLLPRLLCATTWDEKSSTHFRVFYRYDSAFASAVVQYAEAYYSQIVLDLGLTHVLRRDHVPWLWENRCQIYLYPDRQAYVQATGAPAWSGGFVNYPRRMMYSFLGDASFLTGTLPHELAHIVFREFVGFHNPQIPRWLDEGVARYAEPDRRDEALSTMRAWVTQGTFFSLPDLTRLQVGHAGGASARLFYAQAASLVHFFLQYYGPRRFIDFCSALRDGATIERALSFATGSQLRSLDDLEVAWQRFLFTLP